MVKELPKYYETFIPVLTVLAESGPQTYSGLRKLVRDRFYSDLPAELLEQKTKSGDSLILNRIGWAKAYLKQGEMISQPSRAIVQITDKGREVLRRGSLTLKELLSDQDFLKNRKPSEVKVNAEVISAEILSPEEMIDSGVSTIENQVKADILQRLKLTDPYYFEKVILKLFKKMGYGDFQTTPKSGDGGIDGVINQDQLGIDKIYVQAKRYSENKVREKEIRDFIGAMSGDTQKGIFVTTSFFDASAIEKAKSAHHKIILIDGEQLADLMYKHDIGVQIKSIHSIKQVDEDFYEES